MSGSALAMIVSGVPYTVTHVGGRAPSTLAEFAGAVTMRVHGPTGDHEFSGTCEHPHHNAVRVHEKDHHGTGKDVRVWTVSHGLDRPGFVAAG